ncbi:hypothetical protein JHK82_043391 [Glycine max]|nr:hypothetical protein JHK82_043391 [Glycine max]
MAVKRALVDLWQLAFSYQVNPLAAVQPLSATTRQGQYFWRACTRHHSLGVCQPFPFTMALLVLTSFIISFTLLSFMIVMISASDTESLLKFRDSLENNNALLSSWNASIPPCSDDDASSHWPHVQCYKGHVWGLKLESMRLKGVIDVQSLLDLPYLRTISLMNNDFDTAWPEINKVVGLKTIFLSNNKFSGRFRLRLFRACNG